MTIQQLRYLVAVYDYQSFTKAANAIYITQPTLSMQLAKLESTTGKLFVVRSGRIELTAKGRSIYNKALQVIGIVDSMLVGNGIRYCNGIAVPVVCPIPSS